MSDEREADLFLGLLGAAMEQAVTTGEIAQIQARIVPIGTTTTKLCRIIVVPEEMTLVRQIGGDFKEPV